MTFWLAIQGTTITFIRKAFYRNCHAISPHPSYFINNCSLPVCFLKKKKPLSNMFIINILSMPGASTELIHLFIKEIINLIRGLIVGKKGNYNNISKSFFLPRSSSLSMWLGTEKMPSRFCLISRFVKC